MATLDKTGTRNGPNMVRIVVLLGLVGLMLALVFREYMPRRSSVIRSLMAFIEEAREGAVSSGLQASIRFDPEQNTAVLKTGPVDAVSKDEEVFEFAERFKLSFVSFENDLLIFNPDGTPNDGGEIEVIEYTDIVEDINDDAEEQEEEERKIKEITHIEISPSDGEVWILDDEYTPYNRFGAWIGALCVVAIFSYLYKENRFYRVFEHVLLGVSIGFSAAVVIYQQLYMKWYVTMVHDGFMTLFNGEGDLSSEVIFSCCYLFPGIVGLLWYFQYSKKYLWLNRVALGITAGAAAGLGIKGTIITNWPQITGTFKNFAVLSNVSPHLDPLERWRISFESFLILLIVCCVVYYFFFSFRRESDVSKAPANLGRMFLMISLGAFFGNTFLTRVVILIDRIQFIVGDWLMIK
jgi:hypothetical protein